MELPGDLFWYRIRGQVVFPIYGNVGVTISARLVAYLMQRMPNGCDLGTDTEQPTERDGGRWIAIEFTPFDTPETALEKIQNAIRILNA